MPLRVTLVRTLLAVALVALAGCVVNPVPTPGSNSLENDDRNGQQPPGGADGLAAMDAYAAGAAEVAYVQDVGKRAGFADAQAEDAAAQADAAADGTWSSDAAGPPEDATPTDAAVDVSPTDGGIDAAADATPTAP